MIERIQTEDIELELQRREAAEHQAALSAIREHKRAIQRIEKHLQTLEQLELPAPTPAQPPPTVAAHSQQPQQPQLGPCATTLLEIISSYSKPISESELLRITKYSTVMFRKAATDLVNAGKIQRMSEARKLLYARNSV